MAASKTPADPKRQATVRRAVFFGMILILALGVWNTTFEYVEPFEVGIKGSRYAGGIQKEPLPGGFWYLTGPGVMIHKFPTTLQAVEFADSKSAVADANPNILASPSVDISTSDGSKLKVDVTVLYRIKDPWLVQTSLGPGRVFERNVVVIATPALMEHLGRLHAEEFYNEQLREKQTTAALAAMQPALESKGLHVEHILIRQYYYLPDYQKQIEQRKVQDQLKFTQQSRADATKEDAKRRKILSEGEANVAVEKRRGDSEITKIQAEADLYARKRRSEGDLLVKLAEARGTELENTSYEGVGSENMVAEQMADVLRGMDTVVLSDTGKSGSFNPLDLDAMIKMFGAGGSKP